MHCLIASLTQSLQVELIVTLFLALTASILYQVPPFMTTKEGLEIQIGVNHFGTSWGRVEVMMMVIVKVKLIVRFVVRVHWYLA